MTAYKTSAWRTVPIKETYIGLYDGPHATPKPSDDGPVFLGIKNIRENGGFDLSNIRHIAEEDFPKWTKRVEPRAGDIVFTYEATLNRYAVIPRGFRGCLGRRLALIRPYASVVDTLFLYYSFFGEEWKNTIARNTLVGSTVDRIPLTNFPNFSISLPPLPTQRKIASILSAYDDLIENNLCRIKILEEMAQNLYREWFVKFRFLGHEKVKFVDSPLGKIPEGWEVLTLGDVVKVNKGKNITRKTAKEGSVSVVAGGLKPAYYHNKPNVSGPVVTISASGANAGYVNLYSQDIWASDCSYISRTREVVFYYYLLLSTRQDDVFHLQHGSAQPHVYPKDLARLTIVSPPESYVFHFEEIMSSYYSLINNMHCRNRILRKTRDLLLPRLISGELDVSELDIEVPEDTA